jgi:hypothetical protein
MRAGFLISKKNSYRPIFQVGVINLAEMVKGELHRLKKLAYRSIPFCVNQNQTESAIQIVAVGVFLHRHEQRRWRILPLSELQKPSE